VPQGDREAGRDEQDDDEDVLELREEDAPRGDSLARLELVRPGRGEAALRLGRRQPGRPAAEALERLGDPSACQSFVASKFGPGRDDTVEGARSGPKAAAPPCRAPAQGTTDSRPEVSPCST